MSVRIFIFTLYASEHVKKINIRRPLPETINNINVKVLRSGSITGFEHVDVY
jgi:hypothetical protein